MSDRVRAASCFAVARILRALVIGLALLSPACGDKGPTRPPPAGPFTQCPADIQIDSPDGGAVPVNYGLPGASGGTPPYTIVCEPVSGTSLGLGTHTITCRVTDAAGRGALCTFSVRVVQPPRLSLSRFLAFGDSLTEGEVSAPPSFGFRVVEPENSYPTKLEGLLRMRYRGQSLVVINAGRGGEFVGRGATRERLEARIDGDRPEVLLLMEGFNDLNLEAQRDEPGQPYLREAVATIEEMVEIARSGGLRVFLATIPPVRPPGTKNLSPELPALIESYNAEMRSVAESEGAVLVDVYSAMVNRLDLIGVDGLHPTAQGYELIAQTFFDAIRANLEASSGSELRRWR